MDAMIDDEQGVVRRTMNDLKRRLARLERIVTALAISTRKIEGADARAVMRQVDISQKARKFVDEFIDDIATEQGWKP
jgi:polyhydroxyalkanoate synthesis regulator phasin